MSVHPPSLNRAIYSRNRGDSRVRSGIANHARYEACKAEWIASNRGATAEQYEAAMRAIAKMCGV